MSNTECSEYSCGERTMLRETCGRRREESAPSHLGGPFSHRRGGVYGGLIGFEVLGA